MDAVATLAGIAADIEPHRESVTVQIVRRRGAQGRRSRRTSSRGVEASIRFASRGDLCADPQRRDGGSLSLRRLLVWIMSSARIIRPARTWLFPGVICVRPGQPDDWNGVCAADWLERHS